MTNIKKIRTDAGDLQIDYNALANLPTYLDGSVSHVEEKSTSGERYIKIIDAQSGSPYQRICQSMIITSRVEAILLTVVLCADDSGAFNIYNAYYTPLTPWGSSIVGTLYAGLNSSGNFELWHHQHQWENSLNITPLSRNYEAHSANFYSYNATDAGSNVAPTFNKDIVITNVVEVEFNRLQTT